MNFTFVVLINLWVSQYTCICAKRCSNKSLHSQYACACTNVCANRINRYVPMIVFKYRYMAFSINMCYVQMIVLLDLWTYQYACVSTNVCAHAS